MEDNETSVETLSGYPEGTVLEDGSKLVADMNEDGKLIGWHKESA